MAGPVAGGGGGGAFLDLADPELVAVLARANAGSGLRNEDRGTGGSSPTKGPPCLAINSLINSRLSAIISSVIPAAAKSAYNARHSGGGTSS